MPTSNRAVATRLRGKEMTACPMGLGPNVPHMNEMMIATPPKTPWPLDKPTCLTATKDREDAPTKMSPARAPSGQTSGGEPMRGRHGATIHEERQTPKLRYRLKTNGCTSEAALALLNAVKLPLKTAEATVRTTPTSCMPMIAASKQAPLFRVRRPTGASVRANDCGERASKRHSFDTFSPDSNSLVG
jgi:hypothetical protein